jgi:FkbM family methyltransferase
MSPFLHINDINGLTAFEFESACRNYSSYAYLNKNIAICRILTKYKLYVDIRDLGITPHLILDGFWETWLTQCLAKIIKPGDVCIDIGANFGYYSILMSALSGAKGRTLAVEPNPYVCKLLRSTAAVHNSTIEVVEVAVSNKKGRVILSIPDEYFGDASIIARSDRWAFNKKRVKVKTISFDDFVLENNLTKVDVIKIDVEGVEPLVFEGMQQTIKNNPELQIIVEYSPFLYTNAQAFTEYLFQNFIVNRIKDVDEMSTLNESSIDALVQLKDHTDLYLQHKPQ